MKKTGYWLSVIATAVVLIWIGLFKFTPTEAKAIKPLVENHFAMAWLYKILSQQGVSNLIGVAEIMVGIGLLLSAKFRIVGKYAALGSIVIFATTISFLFTTPDTWRMIDGFPITDFFIIKDLAFLGISIMVWEENKEI
jgi:uncharacterized membrane protein YkgB